MPDSRLLYLSRADVVATGLGMADVIEALEVAFREKGEGRVEMPPKPGIHPINEDNFIHAMPAYIPGMGSAGVKWVAGYPENYRRGLPYITGLLILNDPETGLPLSVMDCVWITAMRTGAATAVAARRLARPDSATVGILGAGVQGAHQPGGAQRHLPLAPGLRLRPLPGGGARLCRRDGRAARLQRRRRWTRHGRPSPAATSSSPPGRS